MHRFMVRLVASCSAALLIAVVNVSIAYGQSPEQFMGTHWSQVITAGDVAAERFDYGFEALAQLAGDPLMGKPMESPHVIESGQTVQITSTGLAYYDQDTNTPAFFDPSTGERYAITAEVGLVKWVGPELLPPAWVIDTYRSTAAAATSSPRSYLYATYPSLAGALSAIIGCESGWDPNAKSRISTASGLAQFLTSTWLTTPQGRAGASVFDPIANIDGAAYLFSKSGAWPWLASARCHRLIR